MLFRKSGSTVRQVVPELSGVLQNVEISHEAVLCLDLSLHLQRVSSIVQCTYFYADKILA